MSSLILDCTLSLLLGGRSSGVCFATASNDCQSAAGKPRSSIARLLDARPSIFFLQCPWESAWLGRSHSSALRFHGDSLQAWSDVEWIPPQGTAGNPKSASGGGTSPVASYELHPFARSLPGSKERMQGVSWP